MTVPLWPNDSAPNVNGWVFSSVRPPTVARRTCTLNMRPVASVARSKSVPAWAASGMRISGGLGALGAVVDGHAPPRVVVL